MKMLGSKPGSGSYDAGEREEREEREEGGSAPSKSGSKPAPRSSSGFDDMDDDIPF
jgi:single-strand DNA-binding protein